MAEGFNLDKGNTRNPKEQARDVAIAVQDALQSVADSVQDTIETALGNVTSVSQTTIKDIEKGFKDLSKVGTLLAKTEEEARKGALTRSKIDQVILERRSKLEALTRSIEIAQRNVTDELARRDELQAKVNEGEKDKKPALEAQKKLYKDAADEVARLETNAKRVATTNELINEQLKEQIKNSRRVSRATGMTGEILGGLENVFNKLGLEGFSEEFADGASAATSYAEKITEGGKQTATFGQKLDIAGKGFGAAMSGVLDRLMGPAGVLIAFTQIFKILSKTNEQTVEIGKAQAMGAEAARDFRNQLSAVARDSENVLVNSIKLAEVQSQLSDSFGATRGFTGKQLEDQVLLTENIGIAAEQAGKLQRFSALNSESAEDSVDSIIKQTSALAKQTGIQFDNRKIIEEVANASGQLAANLGNNPGRIGQAVVQMRKFGLNLENAVGMSRQLLDFESSIGNELEAELLTGEELNLERARALALQGDFAGAAAEVASQVGSLAEFQNMNVIAQEALAKAAGLTVDELADSLAIQENLANLGQETRRQLQDRIEQLKEEGKIQEANELARKAFSEEEAKAGLERITAQQTFEASVDRVKAAFSDLFVAFEPVLTSLAAGVASLAQMKAVVPLIAGVVGGLAIKMLLASVAAMTIASALTFGLAAAGVAIGVGLMMNAQQSALDQAESSVTPDIQDGVIGPDGKIITTDPADYMIATKDPGGLANKIAGSGGDSTGIIAKLDRLITAVEAGGDVYMDTNKVGMSLSLGAYRVK